MRTECKITPIIAQKFDNLNDAAALMISSKLLLYYLYWQRAFRKGTKKTSTLSVEAFAVWTGLEPATPCVTGMYSNQLNYHTKTVIKRKTTFQ